MNGKDEGIGSPTGVTAAILAGGLGTRLRSVVADRPKALAEIRGIPFLTHVLRQLDRAGVSKVVICSGYLGDQLETTFGARHNTLALAYSRESSPLGTAGALRHALPLLSTDFVLVLNGDSFCGIDLAALWSWHCAMQADASLVLARVNDARRFGRVECNGEGRVLSFTEKAPGSGPAWVNAGIYLLARELVTGIAEGYAVSLEREMARTWCTRRCYGYRTDMPLLDIGTPESYASAAAFFAA